MAPREAASEHGLRFLALARDVATMSGGTAAATLFNTLIVVLVPKLVSIEDFGYWRLFLLYTGYVGLLHMGFADGALLRWAGKSSEDFQREITPSLNFLTWQHLALMVPASIILAFWSSARIQFIGVTVFVFALSYNLSAVLQFSLQSARLFKPVALATAAAPGAFVLLTFLWSLYTALNFRELIVLYCTAWAGVLVYLWARVRPNRSSSGPDSAWAFGKTCILFGWPVVLANGGFSLVQSADRLVVSSTLPIYDFSQYSLAASTMFVPVAAIAAIYRVFFSHVAAIEHEGRTRVYSHASKFLLLAWSLLLPYFFVLEVFVRRFLPKYVPGLRIAGILLLGVNFLAGIQILHMSFAYLYGRQRQFLLLTIGALVVTFSVVLGMALWLRSLVAVAIGQVVALALWWLANEWNLRETTGHRLKDWLRLVCVFAWSAISYGTAMNFAGNVGMRTLIYYALVVGCLTLTCYPEIRIAWKLLSRAVPRAIIYGARG